MPCKPQPPCHLAAQGHASNLRSPRTGRCARLTTRVSISGRSLSAPGAVPPSLNWRPTCGERAPALRLAVQSPSCDGAACIANTGVSALCDGSGGLTDAEIIRADQAGARSRRHRFYLAVQQGLGRRSCGIYAFVPPIPLQNPPGTPKLQATELRQDKSRNVRPGRSTEERPYISALPRCGVLRRDVRIRRNATKSASLAHSACWLSRDRKASWRRALLGHSSLRRDGSQWPLRKAPCEAGWSA
jgi:hypothetical protein